MDVTNISNLISMVGFPITACIGLAIFCKFLVENNNKNIDKLFTMYEANNKDNRSAIDNNTKVLEKVLEKLDNLKE